MADVQLMKYLRQVLELEQQRYTLHATKEMLYVEFEKILNSKKVEYVFKEKFRDVYRKVKAGTVYRAMGVILIGLLPILTIGLATQWTTVMWLWFIVVVLIPIRFFGFMIYAAIKCRNLNEGKNKELKAIIAHNKDIDILSQKCEAEIMKLSARESAKNEALRKIYSCGILHENYRNFYCVAKIYELLDTGICDGLYGVNGAYSQMRLSQVIDAQKISIQQQRELINTNRMMYNSLQESNQMLNGIFNHTNSLQQKIDDLESKVEMRNFMSQSNDADMRAIRDSVEYLSFAEKQRRLSEGHWS